MGSDDEESDGSDSDRGKQPYFQHKCQSKSPHSPSRLRTTHVDCPSKTDDITMMKLPKDKPHVCYIAPDGETRHCFTLETLYRIAIFAPKNIDDNNNNAPEQLQFLQPPHFRSPMEDDMIDQIGSRFGRGALVIENSTLYKKMKQRSWGGSVGFADALDDEMDEFDSDGEYTGGTGGVGQNFNDRFQRYVQNLMGSQDVYCCPVCYIEADRRLGNMGDEEIAEDDPSDDVDNANTEHVDRFSFLDDPLTILGHLDHQTFEIASTFCFRLLSGVKNHLKAVHGVNLKEVEGNDLFKRFQVSYSDDVCGCSLSLVQSPNTPSNIIYCTLLPVDTS